MAQSVLVMWAAIALRCVELCLERLVARWSGSQAEAQEAGSRCQDENPLLPAV